MTTNPVLTALDHIGATGEERALILDRAVQAVAKRYGLSAATVVKTMQGKYSAVRTSNCRSEVAAMIRGYTIPTVTYQ